MKKKVNIQYQIKSIELVEASMTPPKDQSSPTRTYQYNINIEHRIIPDKKWFFVMVTINILDDANNMKLGHVKAVVNFAINNFDEFLDANNKTKINLPEEMITVFNSISISTTRGIMFSQFKGTYLHNAILPILDPKSFKKEK